MDSSQSYCAEDGRWRDVESDEIIAYLKELTDGDFSATDFRTWNATVLGDRARNGRPRGGVEDGVQAGAHGGGQGGRVRPRQHAGGVPRVVRRPARVRPLRGRVDDRRA